MPENYDKLYVRFLTDESLAYLVSGIFLIVSHYIRHYIILLILGHLLIISSLLILVAVIINNVGWRHRIADHLDIFNGAILVVTFFADILLFIKDELVYYSHLGHKINSKIGMKNYTQALRLLQTKNDSMFLSVMVTVILWVIFLAMPIIITALDTKLNIRNKLLPYLGIGALLFIIVGTIAKFLPSTSVVYVVAIVGLIAMVIFIYLQKDTIAHIKVKKIEISDMLLVATIVFVFSGVLSIYTREFSPVCFFALGFAGWIGFLLTNRKNTQRIIGSIIKYVFTLTMFITWIVIAIFVAFYVVTFFAILGFKEFIQKKWLQKRDE